MTQHFYLRLTNLTQNDIIPSHRQTRLGGEKGKTFPNNTTKLNPTRTSHENQAHRSIPADGRTDDRRRRWPDGSQTRSSPATPSRCPSSPAASRRGSTSRGHATSPGGPSNPAASCRCAASSRHPSASTTSCRRTASPGCAASSRHPPASTTSCRRTASAGHPATSRCTASAKPTHDGQTTPGSANRPPPGPAPASPSSRHATASGRSSCQRSPARPDGRSAHRLCRWS
jgi:hypothetical protein